MKGPIVLDASIAAAWCFSDEHAPLADDVLREVQANGAVVPPLWESEMANVLLVAERRGRITASDTSRFLALLAALPIELTESDPSAVEVTAVARAQDLTAYDALYLVVAMRTGAVLATQDRELRRAAHSVGVPLFGEQPRRS